MPELDLPRVLLICAALCAVFGLAVLARDRGSRAGFWTCIVGLWMAAHQALLGLITDGQPQLALAWWLLWAALPGVLLPWMIAVANIGLLRQFVLACNLLLWLIALGLAWWWRDAVQFIAAPWGQAVALGPDLWLLGAWGGVSLALALGDTVLQWLRRSRPRERLRLNLLLFSLCLLGLGGALDWLAFYGQGLGPWGALPATLGYGLLAGLLLVQRSPRRIAGTLTPAMIRASRQALLVADGDGRIQAANPAATKLLDRRLHQVLGSDLVALIGLDVDELDTSTRLHGAGYVERVTLSARRGRGQLELAVQPLVLRASDGEVLAVQCSLHPGSEDPALSATSLGDPVTGLPGAALGEALIARELRRHAGGSGPLVALLVVKLDDAAGIAARHGQQSFDRLQAAVAERLEAVCDWPLDISRGSGGSFLVLLTQVTDRDEVIDIARRAHELLVHPFTIDTLSLEPPALVAVLPDLRMYHAVVDVLADARTGLEQARHRPAEPCVVDAPAQERVSLALALESAIANEGLDLRFQPVVDLRDETVCGARILLDWAPDGATSLGDAALRRLARRVHLEAALNQYRLRAAMALDLPVRQGWLWWLPTDLEDLQNPAVAKTLPDSTHRRVARWLLELDDRGWLLPSARKVGADLVARGHGLHATEFSRGAMLVTHGGDLTPRTATLDARLVQAHAPASEQLMSGLAQTAKVLSLALRAEGVGKKADLEILRRMGIPMGCGDYLAPIVDAAGLLAMLEKPELLKARFAGIAAPPRPAQVGRVAPGV